MSKPKQTAKKFTFTIQLEVDITVVSNENNKPRKDLMDAEALAKNAFVGMKISKQDLKGMQSELTSTDDVADDWDWFNYSEKKYMDWVNT